jgi:hypothetical protein
MYTLYLDRPETFECSMAVKNANLSDAFARVIVEGTDFSLMFKGQIKDGKCIVPIKRLKGLLQENATGKMKLEVVVEDTYFSPWEDTFKVDEHTSVKVVVKEQITKSDNKPLLEVRVKETSKTTPSPANHLLLICEKFGINKQNFGNRKSDFKQIVKEYFKSSPEFASDSKKYIQEAVSALK